MPSLHFWKSSLFWNITVSIFFTVLSINLLIESIILIPNIFIINPIIKILTSSIVTTIICTSIILVILNYKILTPIIKTKINLLSAKNDPENSQKYIILSTRTDELGELWGVMNSMLKKISDRIKTIKAREKLFELNLQERIQEISHLENYDPITGLPNQNLFSKNTNEFIQNTPLEEQQIGLLIIEINNYKDIVRMLGEEYSTIFIQTLSKMLENSLPPLSILGRITPDQFSIARKITNKTQFGELSNWILYRLSTPLIINNQNIVPSINAGIAIAPTDGDTSSILIRNAHHAVNLAKLHIRNTCQFYTPGMNEKAEYQTNLLSDLQHAIKKEQLITYYQPKVNLTTHKITGMEALIRWKHPTLGLVSPLDYIPLAEDSGLIIPIGEWILKTACEQTQRWNEAGFNLMVAVNLSTVQFKQKHLIDMVYNVLNQTQLSPEYLELEITESGIMTNIQESIGLMKALRGLGISLAIDDFGTGNSSLSYLKQFPVQKLKIDQSFVRNIVNNQDDKDITEIIINLGHTLKLQIIAEGIETAEQLEFLKSKGCDYGQGYYWSKPVDADGFFKLISENNS